MTAYVHASMLRPDGSRDSFQTFSVEHKELPLWWQLQWLQFTASGYGKRIPTRHMVKFAGRWRRVYVCQYSNAGTAYIGKLSSGLTVQIDQ
jgi:hypothetical protein